MVDKLIIKDVQLTAANDDNYFVFEDFILQVKDGFNIVKGTHIYYSFQTPSFYNTLDEIYISYLFSDSLML